MKRNTIFLTAVLALATWALAQQPTIPSGPPASAAPSGPPTAHPPDAPAPPPSKDAGQPGTTAGENTSSGQAQSSDQSQDNPGRPLTSDEARSQITEKLQSEPGLSSRNIHVDVTDSAIQLTGTVPTTNQSLLAQRIAQSYAGTRRVNNNLMVETSSPGATGAPSSSPPEQADPPQGQGGQIQPPQ
jgi:BON domain